MISEQTDASFFSVWGLYVHVCMKPPTKPHATAAWETCLCLVSEVCSFYSQWLWNQKNISPLWRCDEWYNNAHALHLWECKTCASCVECCRLQVSSPLGWGASLFVTYERVLRSTQSSVQLTVAHRSVFMKLHTVVTSRTAGVLPPCHNLRLSLVHMANLTWSSWRKNGT